MTESNSFPMSHSLISPFPHSIFILISMKILFVHAEWFAKQFMFVEGNGAMKKYL